MVVVDYIFNNLDVCLHEPILHISLRIHSIRKPLRFAVMECLWYVTLSVRIYCIDMYTACKAIWASILDNKNFASLYNSALLSCKFCTTTANVID